MPTNRFDEHWDYATEVRQLIEDWERTIRLSKIMCTIAQDLQAEAERVRAALHVEYHKRAIRR